MIHQFNYKGHSILFWPTCSIRTLWMASTNYLFIDGKFVSKSGGFCVKSSAKSTINDGTLKVHVEMRTKTSHHGFFDIDYELLIDNKQIDTGLLEVSFMWNVPQNMEQEVVSLLENTSSKTLVPHDVYLGQNTKHVASERIASTISGQGTPLENQIASVFLSHSTIDKPIVRRIAKRLKQEGINVWIDEAEMRIGDSLIEKISAAIHDTDFVAAVISQHSVKSAWVKKELSLAMTKEINGKRVVVLPLLVEKCDLPFFLSDKLYAVLTSADNFDAGCLQIIETVKGVSFPAPIVKKQTSHNNRVPHNSSENWPLGSRPTGINRPQEAFGALRGLRNMKFLAAVLSIGGIALMVPAFLTAFIKELPLRITHLMLYSIGSLAIIGPSLWYAAIREQRAFHNDANLLMSYEENVKDGFNIPFGHTWWKLYRMGKHNMDYRVGFWISTIIVCIGIPVSIYFLILLGVTAAQFLGSLD